MHSRVCACRAGYTLGFAPLSSCLILLLGRIAGTQCTEYDIITLHITVLDCHVQKTSTSRLRGRQSPPLTEWTQSVKGTGVYLAILADARRFVQFWASGGEKFPKMGDSLYKTPTNHRAKVGAASFILAGEIGNRTNKHTNEQAQQ